MPRFGVYYIPSGSPLEDSLYGLGSSFVSWDIINRKEISQLTYLKFFQKEWIKHSRQYGFHITIGDAIYYDNSRILTAVKQELLSLLAVLDPDQPLIATPKPADTYIQYMGKTKHALVLAYEANLKLLLLHTLILARIHPLGQGSFYTQSKTEKPAQFETLPSYLCARIDKFFTMTGLENYQPHFTLFSPVNENEAQKTLLVDIMQDIFSPYRDQPLIINKIALVIQDQPDSPFYIDTIFDT